MKKILLFALAFAPLALFASSEGAVETDIVQRSVNFVIFAAILYYLLADKIKAAFADRSLSIQAELDKVQDALDASTKKVDDTTAKLEEAKKLAVEIVEGANAEIEKIKQDVLTSVENDIANLEKHFDEKVRVEARKAKKEVVSEILDELLKTDNIELSQDELSNIVLKKVA
jgi:F-type H+-transporting ATPase subunit b